jgi:predicted AlkP superfamily phosphohydrolase/phosphomutase
VRDELAERLAAIPGPDGAPLATTVYRPEEVYEEVNGIAPDLLVYFDDLAWRAVGTVGGDEGIHTFENDTGPDDANHAQDGLLIMAGPGIEPGLAEGMHLLDVAPTVLELLGIEPLQSMRGKSLLSRPR